MYATADWTSLSYKGLGGTPLWVLVIIVLVCTALAFLAKTRRK